MYRVGEMKILWSLALVLIGVFGGASAQQIPVLDFFHGRECPHCQSEKAWFPVLMQAYPDLVINKYEVWHDPANQALMQERLSEIGAESSGVPTNIVGEQVIVGFMPDQILAALAADYGPPAVEVSAIEVPEAEGKSDLTWLWIVLAGLSLGGAIVFLGKKS